MKFFNKNLLNNRSKLVSALKDVYANDVTKVNMLMMAYDINVVKRLCENECNQKLIDGCISDLINKCGFQSEKPSEIIKDWCSLLEIKFEEKICYLEHFNNNIYGSYNDYYDFIIIDEKRNAWWEEFCSVEKKIIETEFYIDITEIHFHVKCNIKECKGKRVKFKDNKNCLLKIDYYNRELHFYTDAEKYSIPNSTDFVGFFEGFNILERIMGINNIDTSKLTNMGKMFSSCSSLTELDLSKFDTSNVTDMRGMFDSCVSLKKLDVSNFDTRNVTDMGFMFSHCNLLTELDVSKFDTRNVSYMESMFEECSLLNELDVSKFNTSNVTNMCRMFSNCNLLTELDVSKFDTRNVSDIFGMFKKCSSLKELDVSKFNTSNVTDMREMFYGCNSLKKLDLKGFNTSKVESMRGMFAFCRSLKECDINGFDTKSLFDLNNKEYKYYLNDVHEALKF